MKGAGFESVLELAATATDVDAARALADLHGGTLYADERDIPGLPFRALVTLVTDDLSSVSPIADVGLYLVCRRTIKAGSATVLGLFPLVHHPELTHRQADDHWRDVHAPLALKHHAFMTHYTQLSVVHTLAGMPLDGMALCGFASLKDLRERFYSEPDSRGVIAADVQTFADTRRSPRRLIVSERRYGPS
ncbi:MAG: EthD domain-containing protein [Pseudomonadales bacterium]